MRLYSVLLAAALGALTLLCMTGAAQAAPPTIHIDLYAGNGAGNPGDDESPDGMPATEAEIFPSDVAVGPDGTVYFTSSGSVRYVDADGDLQTLVAGIGAHYLVARLDGVILAAAAQDNDSCPGASSRDRIVEIENGVVSNLLCQLGADSTDTVDALALAQDGGVYYAELNTVWKVAPNGSQTLIAGTPFGGGHAITSPSGLAAYGAGVLIADTNWHYVRYVTNGTMTNGSLTYG